MAWVIVLQAKRTSQGREAIVEELNLGCDLGSRRRPAGYEGMHRSKAAEHNYGGPNARICFAIPPRTSHWHFDITAKHSSYV